MEFKKKTIIWEDNNEPPKNYIWAKPDGKYYKWSVLENAWVLTDVSNAIENKYDKPETGIPAEDLDENVQASLGKADTAVQPEDVIQTLEITLDGSLPQTGTLSTEEIETLSSDNCILVINNRSYYKSYESDGGIDYLPLGITSVNDGLRTTYFTVDKTTGDYTIAYRYPIQANVQTSGTLSELENIKVGNTTYAIPQIVSITGSEDNSNFTPNENQPSFDNAVDVFNAGGSVIVKINNNVYRAVALTSSLNDSTQFVFIGFGGNVFYWENNAE